MNPYDPHQKTRKMTLNQHKEIENFSPQTPPGLEGLASEERSLGGGLGGCCIGLGFNSFKGKKGRARAY